MAERPVCLDKTINLTRDIMNGEVPVPTNINVTKYFGAMASFHFGQSDVEIPIENIGLAVYANAMARELFTVTRVRKGKEDLQEFEPVSHADGVSIASFVNKFMPNSMNWYERQDGSRLSMPYVEGKVFREDYYRFKQCKAEDETGVDYRETAMREAFDDALTEYIATDIALADKADKTLLSGETIDEFKATEEAIFDSNMAVLRAQAANLVLVGAQVQE